MKTVFDQTISCCQMQEERMNAVQKQIAYAKENSRFYAATLASISADTPLDQIPFITAEDILEHGKEMLCMAQKDIARIVTFHTSGTTKSKRIYFSRNDLEQTIAFFAKGMQWLCDPNDRAAIFMPGRSAGGLNALLAEGLRRIGVEVHCFGMISDYDEAMAQCRKHRVTTIIGHPAQVRRLAVQMPDFRPKNVLLSGDYLAESVRKTVERIWHCEVFAHYGLTESGYGCAVECGHHTGSHIRHDALWLEIIDPLTGKTMPDGQWGEIVLTTLHREAMPLIRYRTGDWGRLLTADCGCGSQLPRLDRVMGRISIRESTPNIYELDEILLAIDDVLDYRANRQEEILSLDILPKQGADKKAIEKALQGKIDHAIINWIDATGNMVTENGKRKIFS